MVFATDLCFESIDSIRQILDPAFGMNIEAVKYLDGVVISVLRTDVARHALYVLSDHDDGKQHQLKERLCNPGDDALASWS